MSILFSYTEVTMSLKAFYNFDGVPAGVQGTSGDALLAPANGMGLVGTRNAALTVNLYSPKSFNINAVGVSGLEAHKIGAGAERRNTLAIYRNPGHPSISAGARVMLLENFDARTSRSWRSVVGFNWIDFTDREPALGYGLVFAWRNNSRIALITRRNDGQLLVGTELYPIERNTEYYIEVELFYDAPENPVASNPISGRVMINKEVIYTWDKALGSLAAAIATVGVEVGYADHASNSFPMWMGLSDIYVVDHEGEAPYNLPLGPQKALLKKPVLVDAPDWSVVGVDATAALTDGSDATYVKTPLGKVSAEMMFDLNLNQGSIVNGVQVLGRGSRDTGASRQMAGTIQAGSSDLTTERGSFNSEIGERVLAKFMPNATADMAVLYGRGLDNMIVRLDT